jgi:hypothetical protein
LGSDIVTLFGPESKARSANPVALAADSLLQLSTKIEFSRQHGAFNCAEMERRVV